MGPIFLLPHCAEYSGLRRKLLNNGWLLNVYGDAPGINVPRDMPFKVPGNIRLTLMELGVIDNPFVKDNNEHSKWVPLVEWECRSDIDLEDLIGNYEDHHGDFLIHFVFGGLDYDVSFFIGNDKIGRKRGMFSPAAIIFRSDDVRKYLRSTGDDNSGNRKIPVKLHFHIQPWWRTHALKSQMAFGWDFAPELRTLGIWKDIFAYITGPMFFSYVYAVAEPEILPGKPTTDKIPTKIIFKIKIDSFKTIAAADNVNEQESVKGRFKVSIGSKIYEFDCEFTPGDEFTAEIDGVELPLWYPYTMGHPAIVPYSIEFDIGDVLMDKFESKIINRKIEWIRNPGTPRDEYNWTIKVNGIPIFIRGINWVPPDALYGRIDRDRYERLLIMIKDARIDMIRVWGGGIEEKRDFYDICDELGIMIWQEFPFACTNYPKEDSYLKLVRQESEGIVLRTRMHPGVVLYCGGNEYNPYINAHIIDILKNSVNKYAPDRRFIEASPFKGDDHNWRVWGMGRDFEAYGIYREGLFRMLTEFGFQAFPDKNTLAEMLDIDVNDVDKTPIENVRSILEYHKGDINNHLNYARRFGRYPKTLGEIIAVSQMLQEYALKYAVEACRSSWPSVSGVFPWQFSDPWPNISWSIVDYNFRPKPGYNMLKNLYADVLAMIPEWKVYKTGLFHPSVKKIRAYLKKTKGIRLDLSLQILEGKVNDISALKMGDIIVHNAGVAVFSGKIDIIVYYQEKDAEKKRVLRKELKIKIDPAKTLLIGKILVPDVPGIKIELRIFGEQGDLRSVGISYPHTFPIRNRYRRIRDMVDVKFDKWWRKRMIVLMEQERLREKYTEWKNRKDSYKPLKPRAD